jgi:hypothetical protein
VSKLGSQNHNRNFIDIAQNAQSRASKLAISKPLAVATSNSTKISVTSHKKTIQILILWSWEGRNLEFAKMCDSPGYTNNQTLPIELRLVRHNAQDEDVEAPVAAYPYIA